MSRLGVVWLLARREYRTRVRTKTFAAATLIGLVAILALNVGPSILETMFGGKRFVLALVDSGASAGQAQAVKDRLSLELTDKLRSGERRFVVSVQSGDTTTLDRGLRERLYDAYLLVPPVVSIGQQEAPFELVAMSPPDAATQARLQSAVSSAETYVRLRAQGSTAAEVDSAFSPISLQVHSLESGAGRRTAGASQGLVYGLVLLLYATIAVYGSYIAAGVVEEKSTRVVEILISTVRPFQLMVGKVAGIGLVALTQYFIWLAVGFGLSAAQTGLSQVSLGPVVIRFSSLEPALLVAFALCFVLGFFAYAGLFAAGGSMVSRAEDAQQITIPLTVILVIVFFIALYAMENPEAPFTVVLSMVPLASPIVMFVRLALGEPTTWQLGLALVLQLATIVLLMWAAGRIFRAGLLLYGRRLTVSTVLQALH